MTIVKATEARQTPLFALVAIGASCAIAGLLTIALWPALTGVPFWDDLYSVMAIDTAASRGRAAYAVTGDLMAFWRPIELTLIAALGPLEPAGYLWVKLVSLVLHAVKALAIALIVRRIAPQLPPVVALIGGLVALAHPIAVSAIVQIDTVSEAIAAASIAWAFLLVLDAVTKEDAAKIVCLAGAAALATVALFGKESAVPAVAALPLAGLIAAHDRRKMFASLFGFGLVLAAAIVVFVGLRYALGFSLPATNDGRYNVGFGVNVLRNLATIAGSLSFSGNTVELIGKRNPTAAIGFVPVVIAAVVVALSLVRNSRQAMALIRWRVASASAIIGLAATAAPALAPMISEHNAALSSGGTLPVMIALMAACAYALGGLAPRILAVAGVLAIAFGLVSITDKSLSAAASGHRAADARADIARLLAVKDNILICITPLERRGYSIYRLEAERWIAEEIQLARKTWPAKSIEAAVTGQTSGCDLTIVNLPSNS